MTEPLITVMPILVLPEKLSKEQLLDKCREQQQTMILQDKMIQQLSHSLAEVCSVANRLSAQLGALVDGHDANDQDAIALQLQRLSDHRKSFQKAKVH